MRNLRAVDPLLPTETSAIFAAIEQRFGFVPPFFGPAAQQPALLAMLWQQTLAAYVDNPLPTVFKELLAVSLGRFCPARYCLMCHTCSLRPLGVGAPTILELLQQPVPSLADVERASASFTAPVDLTVAPEATMLLAIAIYLGGAMAEVARTALARALDPHTYNDIVLFVSHNRMCHEWVSAHPEISFQTDQRYLQNYGELTAATPALHDLLSGAYVGIEPQEDTQAIAEQRLGEFDDLAKIADRRLQEVLTSLNTRLGNAISKAAESGQIEQELRATARFAQELVAIVSHDLRNPLGAILNGAQFLKLGNDVPPRQSRALDRIVNSARRATRLINDLLDFSQARLGGGISIVRQPTDAHQLVRASLEEFELSHPERALQHSQRGPGDGAWDPDRVAQVLSNLIANALTYSGEHTAVEVDSHGEAHDVVLTITNLNRHGPIAADLLPVLFDPFKRGAPTSAPGPRRSVGLGLYIVDQIVRAHDGTVTVASDEASTRFTVRLPR